MRIFLFLFLFLFASDVFSYWGRQGDIRCHSDGGISPEECAIRASADFGWKYRISTGTYAFCGGDRGFDSCDRWFPLSGNPCSNGELWNQTLMMCEPEPEPDPEPEPEQCKYLGAIHHESGEGCYCPAGKIEGLKNIGGSLEYACIDDFTDTENQGSLECSDGSYPVTVDDVSFCWTPDPPSDCPDGSYSIDVDGVQQCWTPDPDSDKCPQGYLYYEINDVGQCVDPRPNIDDPDPEDPGSSSSSGGAGGSSSSSGSTGGGFSFDDSRIVSRLDQTNNKLDKVNSNLDDIKDGMKGEGVSFSSGVSEGAQSFYESEYPGGISGVWDARRQQLMQTPPFEFVNQFAITVGSPGDISWDICVNVIADFGCHDISPPGFVWAFIRICILITAAFLCRALIFGG